MESFPPHAVGFEIGRCIYIDMLSRAKEMHRTPECEKDLPSASDMEMGLQAVTLFSLYQ